MTTGLDDNDIDDDDDDDEGEEDDEDEDDDDEEDDSEETETPSVVVSSTDNGSSSSNNGNNNNNNGNNGNKGPPCARPEWRKDGYCDDANNTPDCGFDGGDCCDNPRHNWDSFCQVKYSINSLKKYSKSKSCLYVEMRVLGARLPCPQLAR